MRRRSKILLCTLALAAPAWAISAPGWFSRATVAASHELIADNVYAAPALSAAQRQRALADLQAARERLAALYGAPQAKPTIIIAADDKEASGLGLRERAPGAALISPTSSYVVLNIAYSSIDVTAHELAHAEFADRLGVWARMTRLPVWFDEGLALQLDWRRGYRPDCTTISAQRLAEVRAMFRPSQFWDGDQRRIAANYQAAKCAAAQVLERHPPHTLYASLARLRDGASFADVFGTEISGAK